MIARVDEGPGTTGDQGRNLSWAAKGLLPRWLFAAGIFSRRSISRPKEQDAAMRSAISVILALALSGCAAEGGRTTQMFPDCTQASAEEQASGKCMRRPDIPDGL